MLETVVFIAGTALVVGAGYFGVAMWWLDRRDRRRLESMLRRIWEVDDDGEEG